MQVVIHVLSLITSAIDGLKVPILSSSICSFNHQYSTRKMDECHIPSDGISLCEENPPLFYASPVLARTCEKYCNLEPTGGKIGSLHPTKVNET